MTIVSSVIDSDAPQKDGRRWIRELHTDNLGLVHERNYLVEPDYDAVAALADYAVWLDDYLVKNEVYQNTQSVLMNGAAATYTFNYSTQDQNAAVLNEAYTTNKYRGVDLINIGEFINALTDTQLMTLFAMDQVTVDALRAGRLATESNLAGEIKNYGTA